jgi:polyisoprenoid-binding protein YceI
MHKIALETDELKARPKAAAGWRACTVLLSLLALGQAIAAPAAYEIDPKHTYPSFEADHLGISIFRGKFTHSAGRIVLDRVAGTGSVDVTVELASVDFGLAELDEWARGPQFFEVAKYPQAVYRGKLEGFSNGTPSRVTGELSLHGVTRPLVLKVNSFKCVPHPLLKRELCGADASATFQRDEFGLTAGREYGFRMDVLLRIQVEALAVP